MNRPAKIDRFTEPHESEFASEVLEGLSAAKKSLPCRFLYDERGSQLFEEITRLAEYYPTRTEIDLLTRNGAVIGRAVSAGATVVEFGSGSSRKTELLLRSLHRPTAYIPIEISASALFPAAERIASEFPSVAVHPLLGSFDDLELLELPLTGSPHLGFFPGSTIGNLSPGGARIFLSSVRRFLPGGALLIGVDLQKPVELLLAAYNDAGGVTAAFNLNLLDRINRELNGTFNPGGFVHEARWNAAAGRIEMHLRSRRQQVASAAGVTFSFKEGETIHTENSYKYSLPGFADLAGKSGWSVRQSWVDDNKLFSLHLLG